MSGKQVTIARHTIFFKNFFINHRLFIEKLTKASYTTLTIGYKELNVFYSTYSYYLKEHDKDTYLRDLIREKRNKYKADKEYGVIASKVKANGFGGLTYDELEKLNKDFITYMKDILEIFEIFCYRFGPSDMIPKITDNNTDYDLDLYFVVYDEFYYSIVQIHTEIHNKLMEFNLIEFIDIYKDLMTFFYGYSYYLQKDTIKELKDKFIEVYEIYNNKEFLELFFNFVQQRLNENGIKLLNGYKERLEDLCLDIYEMINADLPKSNLFPKRAEKIMVDLTLI